MTQSEAVIQAMRENGGYATLGHLYRTAPKIPGSKWGTKTPFASIRRIVQENPSFFKIRPGLWALKSEKQRVLEILSLGEVPSKDKSQEFDHSYYQGLIAQIGNLSHYETFIPHQDKNRLFLKRRLSDVSTLKQFYAFTYEHLLSRARTVDVSWFNERKLPNAFFEVEHSTDIQNSLLKFLEFQDFRIKFYIVADSSRRKEFESKLVRAAFKPIREEVIFRDYEYISEWHSRTAALASFLSE